MTEIGFGIFCTNGDGKLSTNHTFRLKNLTFDRVFEAFLKNLSDFFKLLDLCKREKIEVFRLGSNFIPYASHRDFKEEWFGKLESYLKEASERLKEYPLRITMHPGQFVILNSPKSEVIENSLRELEYHFWVLDSLGVGDEGIVIIHVGGVYGDRERSIDRFMVNIEKNKWLKIRLTVENDEKLFNAREVLNIAKNLGIPFVFDFFHHRLNPSEIELKEVFNTWIGKGVPKMHLSSAGEGRIGSHGDYINTEDFLELYKMIKDSDVTRVHIMIEAKKKEKALEKLRKSLLPVKL
ncbi:MULTISPECIES: UV DNA damage repair endonuclease UvsE [Thermodesulfovibrio]|uniref:UV DNA damage repair endonuclease UvsE n=1 Tax=Thermodesulfovibrio TaxID=28261 RepID=UPI0026048FC2|nr:UV DNA damage repair endonuclease UvsE [Thermodesulfovibrio sp.]